MASIRKQTQTGALFLDFRYKGQRCREYTALLDTASLCDAKSFAEKRRLLLSQTIETATEQLDLAQFQESIDHMIAVNGVPVLTLQHLFELIAENLDAITILSRSLIRDLPPDLMSD